MTTPHLENLASNSSPGEPAENLASNSSLGESAPGCVYTPSDHSALDILGLLPRSRTPLPRPSGVLVAVPVTPTTPSSRSASVQEDISGTRPVFELLSEEALSARVPALLGRMNAASERLNRCNKEREAVERKHRSLLNQWKTQYAALRAGPNNSLGSPSRRFREGAWVSGLVDAVRGSYSEQNSSHSGKVEDNFDDSSSSSRHGSFGSRVIDKARPFFEAEEARQRLELTLDQQLAEFSSAGIAYGQRKSDLRALEEAFSSGKTLSEAEQEALSRGVLFVADASARRDRAEAGYGGTLKKFVEASKRLSELGIQIGNSVVEEARPAFRQISYWQAALAENKRDLVEWGCEAAKARRNYNACLDELEKLNGLIHEVRRKKIEDAERTRRRTVEEDEREGREIERMLFTDINEDVMRCAESIDRFRRDSESEESNGTENLFLADNSERESDSLAGKVFGNLVEQLSEEELSWDGNSAD